jgi:hypothetical protein
MAHFAKVNNGVVENVIVAEPEFFDTFIDSSPGEWIQTSYNTHGGVHYEPNSETPSADQTKALRKNFAGIGYTYDRQRDAFIPPKVFDRNTKQVFESWTLNETTCLWEPPVPYPTDGKGYNWNENAYQTALSDSSDTSVAWEVDGLSYTLNTETNKYIVDTVSE